MSEIVVCALYKFVRLEKYALLRKPLHQVMLENEVFGTVLLAKEGINGTVASSREGVDQLLSWLDQQLDLDHIVTKESYTSLMPFKRQKVKLKKEIVTMGVEGIDPNEVVGTYVKPTEWNALISDPEVLLVDTRNDYEVQVGTFKNALNPDTETFRQFPDYVNKHLDVSKHKKVAMFCTGGIRCEKSTAYLKEQGFEQVYHLQGGILKYLEEVPKEQSLWEGECFVFDERVTVDHQLQAGSYTQCHACRRPLTHEDVQTKAFQKGVSCPHCYDKLTEQQRQRFAERQHQSELARQRGQDHLGASVQDQISRNKEAKNERKEKQRLASRGDQ